jgi:hypothetical protein
MNCCSDVFVIINCILIILMVVRSSGIVLILALLGLCSNWCMYDVGDKAITIKWGTHECNM